ncbi:hypothetical protein AMELA_G00251940 [Ameiurus melas]|uniref:Reelin domain-containing protein n=1 Tax=Ameiurus melas TaxID=219545 RepID=A0A7J5ZQ86_AMEME|nr:hypothetical protein AMELA_G00251940 [Ameiurus melas]
MQVVLFVAFWLQVWASVTGYSNGAPAAQCVDMTPQHGVLAQSGPSPYTIRVSNTTFSTNQSITVTIDGPVYAGLLLKAGSGSSTDAVGTWGLPPLNTKYLACTGTQSAITHSNNVPKSNTTSYTWIPPASLNTAVITATVVSNKTTFWVNLSSANLTSVGNGNATVGNGNATVGNGNATVGNGNATVGNGYAADDQKMAVLFLTLLMSALV